MSIGSSLASSRSTRDSSAYPDTMFSDFDIGGSVTAGSSRSSVVVTARQIVQE
ncbi:hypothetical protein HDU99_008822, partial [Rhizoclosmatium hyalinum]